MQLSFLSRTICVGLISAGLLQLLFDALAWSMSSGLAKHSKFQRPRFVERCILLLGVFSGIVPTAMVIGFLLPAYIRAEDNKSAEAAGVIFAGTAITIAVCFIAQTGRVLLVLYRTHRRCAVCKPLGKTTTGTQLLLDPSNAYVFATAGVVFPEIIVSRSMLEDERFSSEALEVGFAHENAHVRHLDNLKLLFLRSLPHFNLRTKSFPSLLSLWRLFTEVAADEESVNGSEARSLVLAEMLVAIAKESNCARDQALMTLASRDEYLKIRVDRLLQPKHLPRRTVITSTASSLAFISFAITCIVLAYVCSHAGHSIAEYLLHIG
jgi:beta-lactamase regulating signal transducer with metallopeptidase domain